MSQPADIEAILAFEAMRMVTSEGVCVVLIEIGEQRFVHGAFANVADASSYQELFTTSYHEEWADDPDVPPLTVTIIPLEDPCRLEQ